MSFNLPSDHESHVTIQNVEISLGFPDEMPLHWIGQQDVMDQR